MAATSQLHAIYFDLSKKLQRPVIVFGDCMGLEEGAVAGTRARGRTHGGVRTFCSVFVRRARLRSLWRVWGVKTRVS